MKQSEAEFLHENSKRTIDLSIKCKTIKPLKNIYEIIYVTFILVIKTRKVIAK